MATDTARDLMLAISRLGADVHASALGNAVVDATADERARLLAVEDSYLNLSLHLAELALAVDDAALAAVCARRIAEWDPLNEVACRLLMRAEAARSDLSAVRAAYAACAAARREFLDADLSPETQGLFRALTA